MSLNIGDLVVCVDDSMQPHTIEELKADVPNWIKKGKTYTIRGFVDSDFVVGVLLEEIHNPLKYFKLVDKVQEPSFAIWRFKKTIEAEQKEMSTSHIEQVERLLNLIKPSYE